MTSTASAAESRHAQQLLAAIVASSDDAIISKTMTGIVTSWNPAAERIFGYSAAEMVGHPISVLAAPGLEDEMPAILQRLKRGEKIDHFETTRRHKDGRVLNVMLSVSPIYDEAGSMIGASKLARDITSLKQTQTSLSRAEELLEQQRRELLHAARLSELGQVAAALAHEVNQPLSAIVNYLMAAQRIRASDSPLDKLDDAIARALTQAMRAGDVAKRLRSFARASDDVLRPESINTILEDAIALASVDARSRGVKVNLTTHPDGPTVLADRVQIQQVVFNLIRNAMDAMSDQSKREISLAVLPKGKDVDVIVADTGPGLLPNIRARLFEPFVTSKPSGMGIGLSICRRIITNHGGLMWMEENPKGGAVFHFTLPQTAAA